MERLNAICSLIKPCKTFADIGCDHGLVSLYASKICEKVIASDISEVSLKRAERVLKKCYNARILLSDGFSKIDERIDEVVIAGMGGKKIIDILLGTQQKIPLLILAPQHDNDCVRLHLNQNGYTIEEDIIVKEREKYYCVIRARLGKEEHLSNNQLNYGKYYKEKNGILKEFLLRKLDMLKSFDETAQTKNLIEEIEEILKWQR